MCIANQNKEWDKSSSIELDLKQNIDMETKQNELKQAER